MAMGPLVRILTQAVVMGVSVLSKAFMQAYQQASKKGVQDAASSAMRAAGRMPRAQARQILNFDQSATVTREEVLHQYKRYFDLNDPAKGGSLYLQSKIYHAKEALMDELDVPPEEREPEEAAEGGGGHIEGGGEDTREKPRASEPER